MRARALLCWMLSTMLAGPAAAAGVNLAWGGCSGDPEAVSIRTFACDKNSGDDVLFASFVPAADLAGIQVLEVGLDIRTRSGADLPAWWDFRDGVGCRGAQLKPSLQVSSTGSCDGWRPPPRFTTNRYDFQLLTRASAHLVVATGGSGTGSSADVLAGHQYIACKLSLRRAHTTGTTSTCAGCREPVAITVSSVRIANSQTEQLLSQAQASSSALWQDAVTPTNNTTWTALKALYHH